MPGSRTILLACLLVFVGAAAVAQNPFLPGASRDSGESDATATSRAAEGSPQIYSGRVPRFLASWSRALQNGIARLSRRVTGGEWTAAIGAFLLAAVFGVVHIAGPGHGKVFAVSFFAGRAARPRDGIVYSVVVNLVDSLSAFILVMLGYVLLRVAVPDFRAQGPRILELVSYGVIALFGVAHLVSHLRPNGHDHGHPHAAAETNGRDAPTGAHRDKAASRRPPWTLALSVGLVPCPVSTVLLVYGLANDALVLMAIMVLGVSVGGFVTMSGISLAVIAGRARLLDRLHGKTAHRVSAVLEYGASGAIIAVGVAMFVAAW